MGLIAALHLSLFGAPVFTLLLSSLISDLNIGAWPECWVSVKFLPNPHPSERVG